MRLATVAAVVSKKRDGRLRISVKSVHGKRLNTFRDLSISNAMKLFNYTVPAGNKEVSRDELMSCGRSLVDFL